VLDGAVAVFDGVAGVEPQTETVWRQADKYKVPRMCFLNKMDRTGADFYFCVKTIIKQLGAKPAVLQLPIGTESDFLGIIDLVTMEAVVWQGEDLGASFDRIPLAECNNIPLVDAELKARAAEYHEQLVELAVEQDEEVLMEYLEGNLPDIPTLKKLIRKGTLALDFVPVITGTAFKNKGYVRTVSCRLLRRTWSFIHTVLL
jgi:elongation factor G